MRVRRSAHLLGDFGEISRTGVRGGFIAVAQVLVGEGAGQYSPDGSGLRSPSLLEDKSVMTTNQPTPLGNDEILMSKAERMRKHESPVRTNSFELACLGFGHSDFIRHSSFVIRHSRLSQSLLLRKLELRKRSPSPGGFFNGVSSSRWHRCWPARAPASAAEAAALPGLSWRMDPS